MDLVSLDMFLEIARHGSLNKAAQSLFLAQSTLTHRLRQLEKELGTTLFVRTPGGVSLTVDGRRLLPVASDIVARLKAFRPQSSGLRSLSIVAGRAFASYELPRLLGAYRRQHPAFTCYVRSTLYDESIHALLHGTADIAFLGHDVYHPHLETVPLSADRILLAVSPQHPWAEQFPGFDAWGYTEMVVFGDQSAPFRQRVDRFLAERGVFPHVIMELDSFNAVKQMVAQNLGVTLLPERTIREEVAAGKLVAHDIANGQLIRPALIAYPTHKKTDESFQQFVRWVADHYHHG